MLSIPFCESLKFIPCESVMFIQVRAKVVWIPEYFAPPFKSKLCHGLQQRFRNKVLFYPIYTRRRVKEPIF